MSLRAYTAYQGECERILADSDRVLDNTFLFDNPWDMEATHIPYHFQGDIIWDYQPWNDPEWTFMLSRHAFVLNLATSEVITGDKKYGDKALALMKDFIIRVPHNSASERTTWRSLDAAIRAMHWIEALSLLETRRDIDASFLSLFSEALDEYISFLSSRKGAFQSLSNWGSIGNVGLLFCALYKGDQALTDQVLASLQSQLELQVLPDGFFWEQSPMYQAEVLISLLDLIALMGQKGREVPSLILEKARSLSFAFLAMMKPNGKQCMQSDSDDTSLLGLLSHAAFVLSDPVLKTATHGEIELSDYLSSSAERREAYERLPSADIPFCSVALSESGNYYLRSGWDENASYVHFRCGALGSGHGHGDLLHVDAMIEGKDILVDSGRYTYVDGDVRRKLKLPSSHNTLVIHDEECFVPSGAWEYAKIADAVQMPPVFRQGWGLVQGCHLGYAERGMFVMRKVLLIDDVLIILDFAAGACTGSIKRYYHFTPGVKSSQCEGGGRVDDVAFCHNATSAHLKKGQVSLHYNQIENAEVLVLENECQDRVPLYMVMGKGITVRKFPVIRLRDNEPLSPSQSLGLRISAQGKDDITLCFVSSADYQGYRLLSDGEDCVFYGTLAVKKGKRQEVFLY